MIWKYIKYREISSSDVFAGVEYQIACSSYCFPYISYGASWETLIKYQDILFFVIIFFFLMTCMFY